MGQKSLMDMWSSRPATPTAKKRKAEELPTDNGNGVEQPAVKKLKSFAPGGKGVEIDEAVKTQVRERLGGLDAIASIKRRSRAKEEGGVKLQPMHLQIQSLKRDHQDTILLVEEGYKYRVYADDAAIVSGVLGFYLTDGQQHFDDDSETRYEKFATCSFPVTSLRRHTKKLVDLGHKVGIVQQMEQAALAKSGKLLKRELTRKYTKATFSDEFQVADDPAGLSTVSNYLFAITEDSSKGRFGIVAVEPATGDIIYDEFDDGVMLTELETRLLHIQPVEVLHVGETSARVNKLVQNVAQSRAERVIVHNRDTDPGFKTSLTDFYINEIEGSVQDKEGISKTMDMVFELPGLVQHCLNGLIYHLAEYNMSHIFSLSKNFVSFSSQTEMYLSGDTIISLEIFQNQNDQTSEGSLFELLDQTRTQFGRRLLKKWVAKPLLRKIDIEARSQAITELTTPMRKAGMIAEQFQYCMDLEKALANVYYQRSSRPQLYKLLKKLQRFVEIEDPHRFNSEYLNQLADQIPKSRDTVNMLFRYIDASWRDKYETNNSDLIELFLNTDEMEDEDILMRRVDLEQTEQLLESHLQELKRDLKVPLTFGVYGESSYVIVVDAKYKNQIPNDWVPFAKGKDKHKYRSPECEKLYMRWERDKSRLQAECQRAYQEYLGKVATHYNELRDLISALAQLDCIMSLSELARYSHYTKPTYVSQPGVKVVDGRHPTAENAVVEVDYIPNHIDIDSRNRVKLVTGPNMGGKSSYVRQVALIAIMAQIGSYVPAEEAEIGPFDAVYTRMGAYDNMIRGQSTFKVELQECQTIMAKATPNSLVILDEVGRGTSTVDGHAIAHAVLSHFITEVKCATLFITHFPALASFSTAFPSIVGCYRMGFEQQGEDTVRFTYKLEPGVAQKSYGLNVARIAGLPTPVLTGATAKSRHMEQQITDSHDRSSLKRQAEFIRRVMGSKEDLDAESVLELLQSLV